MNETTLHDTGRYLLIPVPPTPNGRLHLGHMAGPYLRMDMLRRSLEEDGNEVELWTGTDSHDSFVLYRAHLSGLTPTEVCQKFHTQIESDMRALRVKVDGFVDTLSGYGRQLQEEHANAAVESLDRSGQVIKRREEILFDEAHNLPVVGTWLAGQCPRCGSPCVGYFCEGCFTHNQPSELLNCSSRMPGGTLARREVETLFLDIRNPEQYLDRLEKMGVIRPAIDVVQRMLATPTRNFRLTVPIGWGLAHQPDIFNQPRAIFEVLWELFTYSEMQAGKESGRIPAWRMDSDTKVVVACGVDNTVALLMGCIGVYAALPEAKPPERIHVNYFVKLEGSKFSTNRNHAIWASDLAQIVGDGVDGIRLYLAKISPEKESTNFDVDDFVRYYNEFYIGQILYSVDLALTKLDSPVQHLAEDVGEILRYREAIRHDLSAGRVNVSAASKIFEDWVTSVSRRMSSSSSCYWWLKGVAILGYPFAPDLSAYLWKYLGHDGDPVTDDLFLIKPIRIHPAAYVRSSAPISSEAVRQLVGRPL